MTFEDYKDASTKFLLTRIRILQSYQKKNRPDSKVWKDCSKYLTPLFAEMARRSK